MTPAALAYLREPNSVRIFWCSSGIAGLVFDVAGGNDDDDDDDDDDDNDNDGADDDDGAGADADDDDADVVEDDNDDLVICFGAFGSTSTPVVAIVALIGA